jgi:6-phosphogluconate dehydrogenase
VARDRGRDDGQGPTGPGIRGRAAYDDDLRSTRSPANLLHAQRDYFGAHTYERIDRPESQAFNTHWPEVID